MRSAALAERRGGEAGATEDEVYATLSRVIDPELDEQIVGLGFVARVAIAGREVGVDLRLPTYWCAPNFSWLMVSDAREAVMALPGVDHVEVRLIDHHASEEISEAVTRGHSFEQAFGADADGSGLEDLRLLFRRKAFLMRQGRALRGLARERLSEATLGELPDAPTTDAYLEVRRELGLDCSPAAAALSDPVGRPVSNIDAHLRRVRMVSVSLRSNDSMCRGLLQTRYGKVSG